MALCMEYSDFKVHELSKEHVQARNQTFLEGGSKSDMVAQMK